MHVNAAPFRLDHVLSVRRNRFIRHYFFGKQFLQTRFKIARQVISVDLDLFNGLGL